MTQIDIFCSTYIAAGLGVAELAWFFLVAALGAAVIAVMVDAAVRLRNSAVNQNSPPARGLAPVNEMANALNGLITALATAPIWLALFAAGIFVFWIPGTAISGVCAQAKPLPQRTKPAAPSGGSNTSSAPNVSSEANPTNSN